MDRYDPYTDKFLRDTQYDILGTNLAEVGMDCISRQAAIDALRDYLVGKRCPDDGTLTCRLIENEVINKLPSAEPKRRGMSIEQEKMIVESLPSLYPMMQKFEEDAIHTVLDALPHWIPVTERLPETEGRYIVINSRIGAWHVDIDFYRPYMGGWMYDQGVLAWMPLPEPSKGVTE